MPTASFGRRARLTKRRDFDRVFADPITRANRYFRVLARPNELARSRLGLVVSRKVDPRAVGRNAIKRLIRESFRHRHAELAGLDLVVLAFPRAREASPQALRAALDQCWNELLRARQRSESKDR